MQKRRKKEQVTTLYHISSKTRTTVEVVITSMNSFKLRYIVNINKIRSGGNIRGWIHGDNWGKQWLGALWN